MHYDHIYAYRKAKFLFVYLHVIEQKHLSCNFLRPLKNFLFFCVHPELFTAYGKPIAELIQLIVQAEG